MTIEAAIAELKKCALVEKSARDDYARYAKRFTDPFIKEKLEWLSGEESKHLKMIEDVIKPLAEK